MSIDLDCLKVPCWRTCSKSGGKHDKKVSYVSEKHKLVFVTFGKKNGITWFGMDHQRSYHPTTQTGVSKIS